MLKTDVPLVIDWFDESTSTIRDRVRDQIAAAPPGAVLLLENTRRYDVERVLWKAKPDDLPRLAEPLAKLANQFAEKIATVYVNEALSAGSLDASSTIVPAAMRRVALGAYVAEQFDGPMMRCLAAQLVVFSGIKIDKLDDLEAVIGRGSARVIFTAGSLAMALKKAEAELAGKTCSLGVAEDPAHGDKPYFIPRERIEQAKRMLAEGRKKGIEFVLPVDFVLQNGNASETIGPQDQQFDIGPKSSPVFAEAIGKFIAAPSKERKVAFHNGVFGMFEDARFEEGTRKFVGELKRLKDAGVEVYIGGGEGGTALERYGAPDHVTHTFTAGGTVLNALGSEPVPYLVALAMAARQRGQALRLCGVPEARAGHDRPAPSPKGLSSRPPFVTIARHAWLVKITELDTRAGRFYDRNCRAYGRKSSVGKDLARSRPAPGRAGFRPLPCSTAARRIATFSRHL